MTPVPTALAPMPRNRRCAEDSVTDSWGRVHGIPWLRVADASLFPDSLEINPYLTVMGLADRVEARSPQLFAEALRKASNSSLSSSSAAALSAAPQLEAALSTGLLELL